MSPNRYILIKICILMTGVLPCGSSQAAIMTVNFSGVVQFSSGPNASQFLLGELVTGAYTLETTVPDLVPMNPDEGRYRNSLVAATVTFHGSGLTFSHAWGPGLFNDVSVFNNVIFADGSSSDQVALFAWSRTGGNLLGSESPCCMELGFDNTTGVGQVPQMVINDAVPTQRLAYTNANVLLHTSSGWTDVLLFPTTVPVPASLPLFASAFGLFACFGYVRRASV